MRNLPIFVEMRDRPAVVIGGGVVAARRADYLVRSGARVTAFAPDLGDDFLELLDRPNFRHVARKPGPGDFEGCALCFIATDDQLLTKDARKAARAAGALVNVADQPRLCDFTMPSIVDRSPLIIAISTGGASPILGRMLKARLETLIPAAYGLHSPSDGRLSRPCCGSDALAKDATPLLGDHTRGSGRGSRAIGKRARCRGASCPGNRAPARGQ